MGRRSSSFYYNSADRSEVGSLLRAGRVPAVVTATLVLVVLLRSLVVQVEAQECAKYINGTGFDICTPYINYKYYLPAGPTKWTSKFNPQQACCIERESRAETHKLLLLVCCNPHSRSSAVQCCLHCHCWDHAVSREVRTETTSLHLR